MVGVLAGSELLMLVAWEGLLVQSCLQEADVLEEGVRLDGARDLWREGGGATGMQSLTKPYL